MDIKEHMYGFTVRLIDMVENKDPIIAAAVERIIAGKHIVVTSCRLRAAFAMYVQDMRLDRNEVEQLREKLWNGVIE